MDDLFASMFGGFSFDPSGPPPRPRRGRDTEVPYHISLEEAFAGKHVVVSLERDRLCKHCEGTGGRTGFKLDTCQRCSGKGYKIQDHHVCSPQYGNPAVRWAKRRCSLERDWSER